MAKEFHLRVLAADRPFYEGPCVSLTVPAVDGSMGILAGQQHHRRPGPRGHERHPAQRGAAHRRCVRGPH